MNASMGTFFKFFPSFMLRAFGGGAAFLSTFVIAKYFGAAESGAYFLVYSLMAITSTLSRVGVDSTILKLVGGNSKDALSVFLAVFRLTIIPSILIAFFLYFSSSFIANSLFDKPILSEAIRLGSFGGAILSFVTIVSIFFQALSKYGLAVFFANIALPFCVIFVVVFGLASSADELILAFNLSGVFLLVIGVVVLSNNFRSMHYSSSVYGSVLSSAMPLWLAAIMSQITLWGGQVILGAYADEVSLGQFGLAQRIAMLEGFVLTAINMYFIPKFSLYYKQGQIEKLEAMVKASVVIISVMVLPIFASLFIFSEFFLGYFGSEYLGAGIVLKVLLVGQLINALTGSVGFLLIISGRELLVRNVTLVVGVASLFFIFLLTKEFGILGAAIGTSFSMVMKNLVFWYFVKRTLGFNTLAIWR